MYQEKSLCVVVPCYNEETQIGKVIETMPAIVDKIIIVDDQSKDSTCEVVVGYQKEHSRVVLIPHEENQGVGGAIATGYKWARDNEIDVTVVMAGDGQMHPGDLEPIIEPVASGEVDYSKGDRLRTRKSFEKIPKIRFFGNSMLSLLTKIASGYWHVADSQTGYTAISLRALQTINWDKMYKRYGQPNDLLVKLNVYDFSVRDVPIEPVYGQGEKSDIKVRRVIFTIGSLLVRLFFWRMKEKYLIRDTHPLVFFYFSGIISLIASLGFLVRLVMLWVDSGTVPELTLLIVLFCFGMGNLFIMFAMFFDMERNKHLK
ncbi:glycosyltransferase family 2 protein [Verrucomicrobiales bacterium BCK34]|nr:glycosyltransferase family 2 protein [Verrucomicrobiales bacterium BCK34]